MKVVAARRHHAPDLVLALLDWRACLALWDIIFADERADGPHCARVNDDVLRRLVLLVIKPVLLVKNQRLVGPWLLLVRIEQRPAVLTNLEPARVSPGGSTFPSARSKNIAAKHERQIARMCGRQTCALT